MQSKRGIALSMETIVIAVIVVVVLVVVLFIFVNQLGDKNVQLQSCSAKSGVCSSVSCADSGRAELQKTSDGNGDAQGCAPAEIYCCSTV